MLQGSDFVSYVWMYAALLHTLIGVRAQIAISLFSFIAMLFFWRISFLRWIFLATLILVAGPRLFVSGGKVLSDILSTNVIRYKIIVEVETPEGLKTGSNVVQVTVTPKFVHWNPSSPPVSTKVMAEAFFIDLGHNKNIVSTLKFGESGTLDNIGELAQSVFKCTVADLRLKKNEARRELTKNNIPVLVTFLDPNNPDTLRVVKTDEFEHVFGRGYVFKGAWIEIVEDAVAINRIEQSLPWVGTYDKEAIAEKLIQRSGNHRASISVGMAFRRGVHDGAQ